MKPEGNRVGNWTGRNARPQGTIGSEEEAKADSGGGLLPSRNSNIFTQRSDFRKIDCKAGVSPAKERLNHAGETPALQSKVHM